DRFKGDDVLLVRDRIGEAVRRAREEHVPTLIEITTYRFRGHSMSDPGQYRTKEEIEEWRKSDPVPVARQKVLDWGTSETGLGAAEEAVKKEIEEAVQFAEESPPASIDDMMGATYAPGPLGGAEGGSR